MGSYLRKRVEVLVPQRRNVGSYLDAESNARQRRRGERRGEQHPGADVEELAGHDAPLPCFIEWGVMPTRPVAVELRGAPSVGAGGV